MVSKIELAYIAGFVDGEGYIGIKKYIRSKVKNWTPMYSEKITVAGINKESIERLNRIIKGYIYFHKKGKLSKRGYWSWELSEKKARKFISMIYPYLTIKKPEADAVLLLGDNKMKTNSRPISQQDQYLREKLYLGIKNLHTYKI